MPIKKARLPFLKARLFDRLISPIPPIEKVSDHYLKESGLKMILGTLSMALAKPKGLRKPHITEWGFLLYAELDSTKSLKLGE
jgi:hypothetical protein